MLDCCGAAAAVRLLYSSWRQVLGGQLFPLLFVAPQLLLTGFFAGKLLLLFPTAVDAEWPVDGAAGCGGGMTAGGGGPLASQRHNILMVVELLITVVVNSAIAVVVHQLAALRQRLLLLVVVVVLDKVGNVEDVVAVAPARQHARHDRC